MGLTGPTTTGVDSPGTGAEGQGLAEGGVGLGYRQDYMTMLSPTGKKN